jgi:hypothetical protein
MLTAPQDLRSGLAASPARLPAEVDERAARNTLRTQIARLERELGQVVARMFPDRVDYAPLPALAGPRLLSLGELEALRDALADRIGTATDRAAEIDENHSLNRELLERMRREPGRYKFVRIAAVDVGERGCGVYHVRPRMGLVGMLAGWWQVKLSSGCPLATGRRSWRRPSRELRKRDPVGRRSRKRAFGATAPARVERDPTDAPVRRPAPATPRRRARAEDAPKAPWAPFPLVELCILLSFVLIIAGVVTDGPKRGVLLGCGFALVTLSSLELSIREHFAGFRSHSTLLAGIAAIVADVPLYFWTDLRQEFLLVVGLIVFGVAFSLLRQAFQRRAGGLGFRA